MLKDFLSEDGKTLKLPVAFGSQIHKANVGCYKLCERLDSKEQGFICSSSSLCRTKVLPPSVSTLTLSNIDVVVDGWDRLYFQSSIDAIIATDALVKEHIALLRCRGLDVDDEGKPKF